MTMNSPFRAVALIDRDGTINEEKDYLSDPAELVLIPGAAEAIRILDQESVAAICCTNQSGIARGYFTEEQLHQVNDRLIEMLHEKDADLEAIYYSPTLPESNHPTRKPNRGMYDDALRDFPIKDLPVYAIGDRSLDVEFGVNCGGKGIRVLTGHQMKEDLPYDMNLMHRLRSSGLAFTAENLLEAVHLMLADLTLSALPDDLMLKEKFHDIYTTSRMLEVERERENRIVLANGCFDILHGGHISYLESARAMGDRLVLAVNSNAAVRRLKGEGRPVLPEEDRLQILAALRYVDYLTVFHDDSADRVLEVIRPDIHAKGTDYTADTVPEKEVAQRLGVDVRIAGAPKENSSRDIIDVIRERVEAGLL